MKKRLILILRANAGDGCTCFGTHGYCPCMASKEGCKC